MSEQDRITPVPLGQLPTRGPLPEDADGWSYARAWCDTTAQYAEIIRHAQHGAAMPRWAVATLLATAVVAVSALGLAAFALYRLCVVTGHCQ